MQRYVLKMLNIFFGMNLFLTDRTVNYTIMKYKFKRSKWSIFTEYNYKLTEYMTKTGKYKTRK